MGTAAVINIKPGRVGGFIEAKEGIHDLCSAHGGQSGTAEWSRPVLDVPPMPLSHHCPDFTLPGDISGSNRFFHEDITEEIVMYDGKVDVPTGVGFGVSIDPAKLEKFRADSVEILPQS